MHKKTLLIVAHMPSDNTRRLGEALQRGATGTGDTGVQARLLSPFDTHPEDVMQADGVVLMKPKNLGYMSGAFKDFLDRTCYPTLEHKQGLPYALVVRAGNDGRGTVSAVERIVTGLRWKAAAPAMICRGEFQERFVEDCCELGAAMAEGLDSGIL